MQMVLPAIAAEIFWKLNILFPAGGDVAEQISLRWMHIVFGTMWIGFIYFLNLVMTPTLNRLDGQSRGKIYPLMVSKLTPWLAISSGLTWLAGFRYFMILAKTDATNIGDASLMWKWLGTWLALWLVTAALLLVSIRVFNNGWVLALVATILVSAFGWLVLGFLSDPGASNRTLCIGVGGGIGTVLFVFGIVLSRSLKKVSGWMTAAEGGAPMHADAPKLIRRVFLMGRMGMWLSFPMLFFMGASTHYPFLSGR
jgi:hypothetical protein